ncbi:transglycosylase [Streptococcus hyovaginalis]|uniref:transglycosylase n=1 Tax=Streptococcus hyovaginalis TaxID=149015 RepID=UPI002A83B25C|nr:transglycosylase [Streptococcus hyovaginalis]MDY4510595.1 transglycosylase [Streptococcus hyovaginalis]
MVQNHLKKDYKMKKLSLLLLPLLAIAAIFTLTGIFSSNSYFSKAESEEVKMSSSTEKSSKEEVKPSSTEQQKEETLPEATPETISEEATVVAETAASSAQTAPAANQAPVVTEVAYNAAPAPQTQSQQVYTTSSTGYALANGNTAGETGSYAAAQMAAATGVSQATWEHIIARESNGQVGARNASGASGLFQTMPGWGSTATVQDQINSALKAYNAQGLAAWGY